MLKVLFTLALIGQTFQFAGAQKKTVFSVKEELQVTSPLSLKASTFDGDIIVSVIKEGNPTLYISVIKNGQLIELTKEEFLQHFVFEFENKGNQLILNTSVNENEKKKYWKEDIIVSYNLRIPKETSCDLYSMKGNVEIKGLLGNQKCNSSDGNVEVEKTTGTLILETSNGNILLKDIEGTVVANTLNGKVQGNINMPKDSVICNSENGTINIILPETTQANLFLKGRLVNSNKLNFTGTFERTLVAGKLNGGGIPIRLTGNNGNVSLFYKK